MLRLKWMRHLAILAVFAMLAAACGDDGATETDPADIGDTTDDPADDPAEDPAEDPADDEATEPEEDGEAVEVDTEGDGVLTLGTVLPETGDLAFLGPPMIAAVELAVQDINEAGGVLGEDVELLLGDSGDGDGAVANQTVDRHLAEGADAIIGAAASGISLTFIDKVTGAGIIQFSPSNTAVTFTDYDDGGFYFRTAPSDALQGPVLADQVVADGGTEVAVLARSDDYGRGLAEATAEALEEAGAEVVVNTIYDQNAQNFDADVNEVASANPNAVILIGFDESARILQSMIENGLGPDEVNIYGVDGNAANTLAPSVNPEDPSVLQGMRGTRPAALSNEEFVSALEEFRPELEETSFAAESYDATVIIALAAAVAGSDAPADVAEEINGVTQPGGTECDTFADCIELIDQGEEITYSGVLGVLNFQDEGEPGAGTYEIWEINDEGELDVIDTVDISL
jgi:ABC-type branched-subunit amino acid transport system substrate-binding protein